MADFKSEPRPASNRNQWPASYWNAWPASSVSAGDGALVTFDGPARAIRCARSLRENLRRLGLEVRAGLHTGECELISGDVAGIAVHIAARVAAIAKPDEVLVSSTVKDLVAGSGIQFADRGVHTLKGVPGEWRVFAVEL